MDKMILILVLIGVLVGGCGPGYYWYKYEATLEETEADCIQCYIDSMSERVAAEHIAKQDAQVTQMPYIPDSRRTEEIGFYHCMKARGYREVSGDFLNPSLRKKFCSPTSKSNFPIAGK